MPAYRSSAEADIREATVSHLRLMIPECRIIHEINAATYGNRIDVLAVGRDRLVAVEIKSAKDKLDRLPDQIKAMKSVTREVFAALHEKFLKTGEYGAFPPDQARGAVTWIFPKSRRDGHIECGEFWRVKEPYSKPMLSLPPNCLSLLWREELHNILRGIGMVGISKLDMGQSIDRIRWNLTGEQITQAVCATLRVRDCCEADAPIYEVAA